MFASVKTNTEVRQMKYKAGQTYQDKITILASHPTTHQWWPTTTHLSEKNDSVELVGLVGWQHDNALRNGSATVV